MVDYMFVLCVYHFWVDFRPILVNCIFWTILEPFSQLDGQKTIRAKGHPKERSNQKVEENKLALELNFLSKYNRGWYIFLRFWGTSQRALMYIPTSSNKCSHYQCCSCSSLTKVGSVNVIWNTYCSPERLRDFVQTLAFYILLQKKWVFHTTSALKRCQAI